MGILPPDFIGLERLRKIRQNPRYRDLLSELTDQRREAAVDAHQSVDRRDEARSPREIAKTNSEPVGLMVTQDRSDPLKPSENASALAGTAVACASSSRAEDDDGFSRCMETDTLVNSPWLGQTRIPCPEQYYLFSNALLKSPGRERLGCGVMPDPALSSYLRPQSLQCDYDVRGLW